MGSDDLRTGMQPLRGIEVVRIDGAAPVGSPPGGRGISDRALVAQTAGESSRSSCNETNLDNNHAIRRNLCDNG